MKTARVDSLSVVLVVCWALLDVLFIRGALA